MDEATAQRVREVIASLGLLTPSGELRALVDSLEIVNLYVALEGGLGISIPPEEVTPPNFASVASLVALVGRLSAS